MNTIHICTTHSLRAGLENIPPMECWLCGRETMFLDYCGARCDTCNADAEDIRWSIGAARQKAGFRRRDFAAMMGVKPKTVSVYEHDRPSRRYIERCKAIFREHYGSAQCS